MMLVSHNHRLLRAVLTVVAGGWIASAATATTIIFGGPTYNSTTQTGYQNPQLAFLPGATAGDGVAVGAADKFEPSAFLDLRAVRWDASGAPAVELGNLSIDDARSYSAAFAVNAAGTAVGVVGKFVSGS